MGKTATVTWKGDMHFTGTTDTGFGLTLDADPSVGGQDMGFRPLELMLVSLAGCTAMDVISILRKKRQDVTGFEVRVEADQANDHPRVYTDIRVVYMVRGRNIDPAAVERSIELSETKYCPASAMLRKTARITSRYEIIDEA
ncbi:MAG: OsmC family peroxiredoxin [Chloroflexi bacterium]|nr:MAG: OsmC family peroxiredoxin [Chloroflexota bacterium]